MPLFWEFRAHIYVSIIAASVPQGVNAPSSIATHTSAQPRFHADEPATSSPTSTEGWGDAQEQAFANDDNEKDGWGDMDLPAEPAPAPALARIHAAQQKPIATQKKPVATLTSTSTRIVTKPGEFELFYMCVLVDVDLHFVCYIHLFDSVLLC